ncbi:MAG: MFS transporter [Elusimicrobiota bacterium]
MRETKDRLYIFFIATYFAQGMVGIAYVPINYLLKDALGLTASESAVFVACMSVPFLLKPLLGVLTDAFPILLRRRTPYLLLSAAATCAGWALLALIGDYVYAPTLLLLTGVNVGICFADVLCDGIMVERGKREGKTGLYQAVQIGTLYLTLLATGVGGGWLAAHVSYRGIFALTALFPLLIFAAAFLIRDEPLPARLPIARLFARGLATLLRSRRFWTASLVILLFNFSPFNGTAWFYYQTECLEFSKLFVGTLTSVGGVAGMFGAWLFWKLYNRDVTLCGRKQRADTALLVRASVLAGIPLTLLFLAYRGTVSAIVITALSGVVGVVMRLSLMDLAAKSCPEHGEATAFALFMSMFNLSAWASNTLGAGLYERLTSAGGPHAAMALLIVIGAACIAACWPFLSALAPAEIDGAAA